MKISVFGAGYVGLVTAVCLAELGHDVVCIDNDKKKIEQLGQGILPLYEEGLQLLLDIQLEQQKITFTHDPQLAVQQGHVIMIAVGTPIDAQGGANLNYVYEVATTIANYLDHDTTVILKSTVPPGTADKLTLFLQQALQQRHSPRTIDVASNPEFLQEGTAIRQFRHPDRIIVGAKNVQTLQTLFDLYEPLIKSKEQFVIMSKTSAELTKYAANALLATKVSFINEISQIAESTGADIHSVKQGIGLDYRINPLFLNAGCGFGGSCFPKDIMALIATAKAAHVEPSVLQAVLDRNTAQQEVLFHRVRDFFQGRLQGKTIALWGLTFKPNTDDVRCATSHKLAELFWQAGCFIKAYDPLGMGNFAKHHPDQKQLALCTSPLEALEKADVLVITTEWNDFKQIPLTQIQQPLRFKAVFDGRNVINPEEAKRHNLHYYGIGRPRLVPTKNPETISS